MMSTATQHRFARLIAISAGGALAMAAAFTGTASAEHNSADQQQRSASPMAAACPDGTLCVWDQAFGQGHRIDLYKCQLVDVRASGLSRVGSFVNNQYDGTVATFKGPQSSDPDGPWSDQYTSTAFEIRDGNQGFLTYGIQVC